MAAFVSIPNELHLLRLLLLLLRRGRREETVTCARFNLWPEVINGYRVPTWFKSVFTQWFRLGGALFESVLVLRLVSPEVRSYTNTHAFCRVARL